MNNNTKILLALMAGIILGFVGAVLKFAATSENTTDMETANKQPLYWVAPMDPNYRRDKPGKSPMGMDLIPVYEEGTADTMDAGTVSISAVVENNLGVRTTQAVVSRLRPEINTVGYVRYDEDQLVHIHPRVEGWVEKLFVKASGDPVTKGEELYSLYSPQLVNAQEELVLAVNRNNRRLIAAAEERLLALQMDKPFIEALKRGKQIRQTVTFYAPKSGVVDNLNIREGFFVKPGLKLMSIGVLDDVWVEAEVFASQARDVQAGLPVTMTLDYFPGRRWQGEVDYVYPSLNEKTRTLRLRLRFDNPDQVLRPNMYAQITVHQNLEETLLVPREAVIRTGDEDRVVLALGDGKFKSVAVTLGRSDRLNFEILDGLEAGAEVVTSAQFLLDSESSKAADFARMAMPEEKTARQDESPPQSAQTSGVINHIDTKSRVANISRGAIEKWNRPPATMDFSIAAYVDLQRFSKGDAIQFEFEIRDGEFIVTKMHLAAKTAEQHIGDGAAQQHGEQQDTVETTGDQP